LECVFVVANDRAQLRIVRTGKHTDDEIEILSGLDSGERVVVEGADQLRDGQPITLQP
jgi:multidrug efflux pump subunit AcrA (membrane-fusion protein)